MISLSSFTDYARHNILSKGNMSWTRQIKSLVYGTYYVTKFTSKQTPVWCTKIKTCVMMPQTCRVGLGHDPAPFTARRSPKPKQKRKPDTWTSLSSCQVYQKCTHAHNRHREMIQICLCVSCLCVCQYKWTNKVILNNGIHWRIKPYFLCIKATKFKKWNK